MEQYPTRRVSRRYFLKKMRDVKSTIRYDMEDYIFDHSEDLSHFEFGRIPGHRIYKIVLKNGTAKEWSLTKN